MALATGTQAPDFTLKTKNADGLADVTLSDFNKDVSESYDVLYADLLGFKGVSKRSAFVIDESGIVTYSESSDDPHDLPNFDAIKAALA